MRAYNSLGEQLDRLRRDEAARKARIRNYWDPFKFFGILLLICIGLTFFITNIYTLSAACLLASIVLIIFSFFFFGYTSPQGQLSCDKCDARISLDSPWVCGHCKTTHDPAELWYPLRPTFLEPCINKKGHCTRAPHSIFCPGSCQRPIIISSHDYSGSPKEIAYLPGFPPVEHQRPPDDTADKLKAVLKRQDFLDLVYDNLGLATDRLAHPIGTSRIIDMPDAVIDAVVDLYRRKTHAILAEREARLPPPPLYLEEDKEDHRKFKELENAYTILTFERYLYVVKKPDKFNGHFVDDIYVASRHHSNREGWYRYIEDVNPQCWEFLHAPIRVAIPEAQRRAHTYIVAASGEGKSECMKLFVHSLLTTPDYCATIVIDPAGDFAEQIARWSENAHGDRLVYIAPYLDLAHTPTINPFHIADIAPADTSPRALAVKQVVAHQLVEALKEVAAEGGRGEISKNMKTVLRPCILGLLDYPGATLRDLEAFMDKKRNSKLLEFACSLSHYPDTQSFFQHGFNAPNLDITKGAIRTKLYDLLTGGTFANLTCGENTVNLEKEWTEKKVIVFNLSKGKMGDDDAQAFGRLLLALLQGIAKRSADIDETDRVPCHLFVDEMEDFLSESIEDILRQSRKYKLIFTGCQQQVGSGMSDDMKKAILGSSNITMAGANAQIYRRDQAALFPVEVEDIATLQRGDFFIRAGKTNPPFRLSILKHLLGKGNAMPDAEWERVKKRQLQRYYRPIQPAVPQRPASEPEPVNYDAPEV